MPDSGSERGRGGTRTVVASILAGTQWSPADTPQDATHTARDARDLAVRLRPVLSKLAQQPRGGRRRDQEWLPAVEQLAVDAQYFASWWLPRLEGKSAQSWPSWSADGFADWVKRLESQRVRTLEMVEAAAPVGRMASVTPLRPRSRGRDQEDGAAVAEAAEAAVTEAAGTDGTAPEAGAVSDAAAGRAAGARSRKRGGAAEESEVGPVATGPGGSAVDWSTMADDLEETPAAGPRSAGDGVEHDAVDRDAADRDATDRDATDRDAAEASHPPTGDPADRTPGEPRLIGLVGDAGRRAGPARADDRNGPKPAAGDIADIPGATPRPSVPHTPPNGPRAVRPEDVVALSDAGDSGGDPADAPPPVVPHSPPAGPRSARPAAAGESGESGDWSGVADAPPPIRAATADDLPEWARAAISQDSIAPPPPRLIPQTPPMAPPPPVSPPEPRPGVPRVPPNGPPPKAPRVAPGGAAAGAAAAGAVLGAAGAEAAGRGTHRGDTGDLPRVSDDAESRREARPGRGRRGQGADVPDRGVIAGAVPASGSDDVLDPGGDSARTGRFRRGARPEAERDAAGSRPEAGAGRDTAAGPRQGPLSARDAGAGSAGSAPAGSRPAGTAADRDGFHAGARAGAAPRPGGVAASGSRPGTGVADRPGLFRDEPRSDRLGSDRLGFDRPGFFRDEPRTGRGTGDTGVIAAGAAAGRADRDRLGGTGSFPRPVFTADDDLDDATHVPGTIPGHAGPPNLPPRPSQSADVARMVRYVLAVVLFIAGAVLVVYATTRKSPSTTADPATRTTPPVATQTTGSGGGPGGAPSTVAPTTGQATTAGAAPPPASKPSSAPKTTAPSTAQSTGKSAGGTGGTGTSGGTGGTSVTGLSITSLAADQSGSTTYVVRFHVQTSGTGPVTVTLTVAGSSVNNSPGSVGLQTFSIPLSGSTSYDQTKILDDHLYCPAPYLGVQLSAPGGSASYKDATSAC